MLQSFDWCLVRTDLLRPRVAIRRFVPSPMLLARVTSRIDASLRELTPDFAFKILRVTSQSDASIREVTPIDFFVFFSPSMMLFCFKLLFVFFFLLLFFSCQSDAETKKNNLLIA